MSSAEKDNKEVSRRHFVKGTAVGGVAGLVVGTGAGALMTGGTRPWLPAKWDLETDMVVVGSGYAGCNAAIAGHDAGAEVIILEKAPERFAGGNSAVSGGGMRIPTNLPDAVKFYGALGFGTVPEDLVVALAEAIFNVPEQLKKMGINIAPISMFAGTPLRVVPQGSSAAPTPRAARSARALNLLPGAASANIWAIVPEEERVARMGTGYQLYLAHKKCLQERKIQVHYETPARQLIQNPETKEILGIVAEQQGRKIYIKAKRAVVLACGGYEANYEMQGYFHYPGIKIYPWGSPYNTGDGFRMVCEVGAPLWHMVSIEWDGPCVKAPSEQFGVSIQTGLLTIGAMPGSYILVNKYGRRFMNESKNLAHNKETLELTYFDYERVEYPNLPFYVIFDETFRLKGPLVPRRTMCWNGVYKLVEWSADNSAEIEKGWIIKANTIKDLAARMGIDGAELSRTVAGYNEYCRIGIDAEFERPKNNLLPLTKPPFYGAELALTCTNTQGGPKHNGKAQTLDGDNKPIPRLYTPGEFGSFFGFLYPGGSNIPEAIAFGRIAGENAAAERPWSA